MRAISNPPRVELPTSVPLLRRALTRSAGLVVPIVCNGRRKTSANSIYCFRAAAGTTLASSVLRQTQERVCQMAAHSSSAKSDVAEEILSYLRNHPNAADTLEGILKWWLPRQRYETEQQRIEQALEYL